MRDAKSVGLLGEERVQAGVEVHRRQPALFVDIGVQARGYARRLADFPE